MSEEIIERTFEVSSPARLCVSNLRGSVDVQPGNTDQIKILAVKHPDTGDADRTWIEIEQENDGSVVVATRYEQVRDLLRVVGSRPCRVDYTVQVPKDCSLRINTVSSSAGIRGLEGIASINSVSGSVTVQDHIGELRLEVVSASALLTRISGPLVIKAVSGDVKLLESISNSIHVSTVSGDMNLETPLGDGPYTFHSVSGDIRLVVPGETSCRVLMTSISGQIHTDLPTSALSRRHGRQYAEIQGGGVNVHVETISGSFVMKHTGDVKAVLRQQRSAEERRRVIERVENGEITVEEALGHLR